MVPREWSQEKTKTMLMQNLGGGAGGQTKSIMAFSKVANFKGGNWTHYKPCGFFQVISPFIFSLI